MTRAAGDLVDDLIGLLDQVGGGWSVDRTEVAVEGTPRAQVSAEGDEIWLASSDRTKRTVLTCPTSGEFGRGDVAVLREMVAVFAHDLDVVGVAAGSDEVWNSLADTRFLRGAVRLSSFPSHALLAWIRTFAAAAQQTYEGQPFSGRVVLVKDLSSYLEQAGGRFRRFTRPIEFQQALLRENWLKPFLQHGEFSLVVLGETGEAYGFSEAAHLRSVGEGTPPLSTVAATVDAEKLPPGACVLTASSSGDITVQLVEGPAQLADPPPLPRLMEDPAASADRITFVRGQGRWHLQNWAPLEAVLERHCEPVVARNLLELVKSARERHTGALIVVLPEEADVSDLVPDHAKARRNAHTLRDTVRGMNIREPFAARVLGVAAHVDGAVLVASDGTVLDVASLISEPDDEALARVGQSALRRFGGGRTTAAWNASMAGLAIKVSDDGPVVAYAGGDQVFRIG